MPGPTKRKIAVFDIDGTIFRSSLLIEAFHALIERGIFPSSALREVKRDHTAWLDRKGHYDDYLMKLVRVYYRHLRGKRPDVVEPIFSQLIRTQRHRVYRYTRDLIPRLRAQGYYLVALSNSQDAIVKKFASTFDFDHIIGRSTEVRDGRYTGHGIINGTRLPVGVKLDKPKLLTDFLATHDIVPDLPRSLAIGDSEGDLDILSTVGKPIAFNPSFELARVAKRRAWTIVIERKDVMYEIKDAAFLAAERPRERAKF